MLDDKLKALWTRISPPQKAAFFGCFLSGYLVHLYVFTNIIPNSDGLSRIFDPQQMTVSGRWFLHFASYFNGFTQMPAVIGLFSVLFLALAAALAVSLLGIRSRALSALSGALMAAFPAVGYTFLYLFTASAYCFAIFLAVLSVSLARRGRWHWLAGCLLLACSMGTYQAYVTVAIGLSLLVIFRETLDPSASFSATLRLGVRLMLFLAAGAVLYYGILLVFLQVKDLELLSYLGMDAASSGYPFSRLPGLLLDTLQAGGGFLLPARFRQHLHLRLDGRAGSGRAGAGRGLLPAVHGAGGALAGTLAPPGRAGHAGSAPSGHQLRPDPQPLVRPHPPDEIRLCAGLSGGGAAG